MNKNANANKNLSQIVRPRNLILLAAAMLVIAAIFYLLAIPHKQTIENSDHTFTTVGIVTLKRGSCGGEKLQSDGTVKQIAAICDGGNYLTVNNHTISTGGGALRGGRPEREFDITNIHPGNWVEIRYAKINDNNLTTNCQTCYVKLR